MIIGPPPKFHGTWDILAVSTQELQLRQLRLEHLRRSRGGAAAQPRQASYAQLVIDVQQPVQACRARRGEKRGEPMVGLGASAVAGSCYPPRQRVR